MTAEVKLYDKARLATNIEKAKISQDRWSNALTALTVIAVASAAYTVFRGDKTTVIDLHLQSVTSKILPLSVGGALFGFRMHNKLHVRLVNMRCLAIMIDSESGLERIRKQYLRTLDRIWQGLEIPSDLSNEESDTPSGDQPTTEEQ